jgi:hypothetical protein
VFISLAIYCCGGKYIFFKAKVLIRNGLQQLWSLICSCVFFSIIIWFLFFTIVVLNLLIVAGLGCLPRVLDTGCFISDFGFGSGFRILLYFISVTGSWARIVVTPFPGSMIFHQ